MTSSWDPVFGTTFYICRAEHRHQTRARALECESRPSAKGSAQALFAPRPWTFDAMSEDAIARRVGQ